ncbi:MAG: hypothetical protein RSD23_09580, partial [Ruthenibacterium sp.]
GGFCVHFGEIITVGTDSLVISHFLGLAVLGVYSNYLLIIGIVTKLSYIVINAVRASASNLVVSSSSEKSYEFFRKLNFFSMTMLGFFVTCLITLLNPFITIWIGKDYLMTTPLVILAVLVYLTGSQGMQVPIAIYRNATGLYYKDRYMYLLEGFVNLFISIILVQKIGLAGVFLGTILSKILTMLSGSYLIYRYIFHRKLREYWKNLFGYILLFVLVGSAVFYTSHLVPCTSWFSFFIMALICVSMTLTLYALAFWRTPEFQYFVKK